MQFNYCPSCASDGTQSYILIDTAINDGNITNGIMDLLEKVLVRIRKLIALNVRTRPTFPTELADIHFLFFSTDPDRSSQLRAVKSVHFVFEDKDEPYNKCEWAITRL